MKGFTKTKIAIAVAAAMLLSGCGTSMFNTGGQAHYTYSKCKGDVCTEIDLLNTKDIKSLSGKVEIKPDGTVIIVLDEKESNGSDLATINASNQSDLINLAKSLIPVGN